MSTNINSEQLFTGEKRKKYGARYVKSSVLVFFSALLISFFMDTNLIAQQISVRNPLSYLALGDSYTIGESVAEEDRWPNILARLLEENGIQISNQEIRARTGWTTTNLISSLESSPVSFKPNLVSLLIGVNNQYQGRSLSAYEIEFEELIQRSLEYVDFDTTAVFVLSIPDYAYTPFGGGNPSISHEIDLFNESNKRITDEYGIRYIDITGISRRGLEQAEYVAIDGLHPSADQYRQWVMEIQPFLGYPEISTSLGYTGEEILVYPNPVNVFLHFRNLPGKDEFQLLIFSIEGVVMKSQVLSSENQELNLQFLSSGIYYWKIKSDTAVYTGRFIKQ